MTLIKHSYVQNKLPRWLNLTAVADEITGTPPDASQHWPPHWENYYHEAEPSIIRHVDPEQRDEDSAHVDDTGRQPPFEDKFPSDEYTRRSLFPIRDVASGKQSDMAKEIELEEIEDDDYPEFVREKRLRAKRN